MWKSGPGNDFKSTNNLKSKTKLWLKILKKAVWQQC